MRRKSFFLVVDGPDGCGKTTTVARLKEVFHKTIPGFTVDHRVFPSKHTPIGQLIRSTFDGSVKIDPVALGMLFSADGVNEAQSISQALSLENTLVIAERYPCVTGWAYQTEHMQIEDYLALSVPHLMPNPDLVCILDAQPHVLRERVFSRDSINAVYEKNDLEYFNRLRMRYHGYATFSFSSAAIIPTTQHVDAVCEQILESVMSVMKAGGQK